MGAKTEEEKQARRTRAKRRREEKEAGTYIPRGQRKAKKRKEIEVQAAARQRSSRSLEEREAALKRQRSTETQRLKRRFRRGEAVLIKARIHSHIGGEEKGGVPRYYVEPVADLKGGGQGAWILHENCLVPWPRRKK